MRRETRQKDQKDRRQRQTDRTDRGGTDGQTYRETERQKDGQTEIHVQIDK